MKIWVGLSLALTMPIASLAANPCAPLLEPAQFDLELIRRANTDAKTATSFAYDLSLRHRVVREYMDMHSRLKEKSLKDSHDRMVESELKQTEKSIRQSLIEVTGYLRRQAERPTGSTAEEHANLVLDEIQIKMSAHPLLRDLIQDQVQLARLAPWPTDQRINLLLGSAQTKPTTDEIKRAQKMLAKLIDLNNIVLLDGRSKLTPHLLNLYPGKVFSVQATDDATPIVSGDSPQLYFTNTYNTLDLYRRSGRTIASFDSIVGVALALHGERVNFLDANFYPDSTLARWSAKLYAENWHLGLRFPGTLATSQTPDQVIHSCIMAHGAFPNHKNLNLPQSKVWREFPPYILLEWAIKANRFAKGALAAKGPRAVIFGSGSMDPRSTPLVYDVAYLLGRMGVGVATGGSGGAMLAGNMGAFDSGGVSVGIPITGRALVDKEDVVYRDIQTKTVEAQNYAERIPWLTEGRDLFIVAPGGAGTQREIVASLLEMAEPKNLHTTLVLLNRNYFGPLYDWLQRLPLDRSVLERIRVINHAEEILPLLQPARQPSEISVPRSTRHSLPQILCPRADSKLVEAAQTSAGGS